MKKAKVFFVLCALIAIFGLTACNNSAEVRDGKSIDKAIIVDIYKENTATFNLQANESIYVFIKGDGTMNDFTFKGPTGSKIDYVAYNEDKSFSKKWTDEDACGHDVSGIGQSIYIQLIAKTAGEYSYTVTK